MKKIIFRFLYSPFGLIKMLLKLANDGARDIQNKRRFSNSIIDAGSSFTDDSKVGIKSHILSNCTMNHSQIGNYSYCGKNALIQYSKIGNYCSIANEVIIGLGSHPIHLFSTSPVFYKKKNPLNIKLVENDYKFNEYKAITIGNDVWIGARVIVMDGVSIGDGAIIAAGAVVTKDIPAYAIVAGIPAKVIKYRFDPKAIKKLLNTKWWEKTPDEIDLIETSFLIKNQIKK